MTDPPLPLPLELAYLQYAWSVIESMSVILEGNNSVEGTLGTTEYNRGNQANSPRTITYAFFEIS